MTIKRFLNPWQYPLAFSHPGQLAGAILLALSQVAVGSGNPPPLDVSAQEPVKYVGEVQPDKRFFDGGLDHVVGVHAYQAYRANRTRPPEGGELGWTYNHAPYLAYWKGKFYLQFLSCVKEEHVPPGRTLVAVSENGKDWLPPRIAFPPYALPEIHWEDYHIAEGTFAVMSQRMGFYVAPNGRLLTLAYYSFCPNPRVGPNLGQGLGRVVREIKEDGSMGPIYFIRYGLPGGWNETNTRYPFFRESADTGFVEACEALLGDRLMTLQWWEHDRGRDGFFPFEPKEVTKALSYYHRPDGVVVALWKHQWSALSGDEGETWTEVVKSPTLWTCGAKVWGQRTADGRYALVYDHSATRRNRFPLSIMTGEDGHAFDNLLCLNGEVPPIRYQGIHKNVGFQYIRGILEGNGEPPGDFLWNTYGMNKEDMWVSRTALPIRGSVEETVSEDFEGLESESDLVDWNLYVPEWAPLSIVTDPTNPANHCLEMRDEEPYDYSLVERPFPESERLEVSFRVYQRQVGHGKLEFEVHDRSGNRPVRLRFDPEWMSLDRGPVGPAPIPTALGDWLEIRIKLDCPSQTYDLELNGELTREAVPFAAEVKSLDRMVFRTGPWRGFVPPLIVDGEPETPGLYLEDEPGADDKVTLSVFLIDSVQTKDLQE